MLLKVQELVSRQEPVQLQGTLDTADIFQGNTDYIPTSPLEFNLTAQAFGDDRIIVTGQLSCNVRMQCSRCLESVDERLNLPFEEVYRIVSDLDAELDEDDEAIPVSEDRIEIAPFIAEELLVQLPYAPLCREDCKGLCPECGTNRNEQSCDCNTVAIDPRLAALQDWFNPQQE
ncbi:MAG: DUF177 domain-containing protein [Candidatus Cohnella colombiensis]|uniref:DUF177 domain-containing protein n=1 Tax=Candidatus Cohnella colombiensis TaxID=3121368 RepID=A0AA95F0C0_9BACL|nr:MAG: DUF177 domain-containing protein [Cohnella sp.]